MKEICGITTAQKKIEAMTVELASITLAIALICITISMVAIFSKEEDWKNI